VAVNAAAKDGWTPLHCPGPPPPFTPTLRCGVMQREDGRSPSSWSVRVDPEPLMVPMGLSAVAEWFAEAPNNSIGYNNLFETPHRVL